MYQALRILSTTMRVQDSTPSSAFMVLVGAAAPRRTAVKSAASVKKPSWAACPRAMCHYFRDPVPLCFGSRAPGVLVLGAHLWLLVLPNDPVAQLFRGKFDE